MARPDLDLMRAQIIDTEFLTRSEMGSLKYWSEAKLLDVLATFQVIQETEAEFETDESDFEIEYDEPEQLPGEDYGDEFYDDLYGFEYEVVVDYGND